MSAVRSNASSNPSLGAPLYLRRWSVIVTSGNPNPPQGGTGTIAGGAVLSQSEPGLDLRFTFQTQAAEAGTPNIGIITVYNLSDQTMLKAVKEFDHVIVQAGYKNGPYGVVFSGTIKMYRRGHENQTDTFLRIYAADWDIAYSNSVVNSTFPAGWTFEQVQHEIDRSWADNSLGVGYRKPLVGGTAPAARGKVLWGMSVAAQNRQAASTDQVWHVADGKLVLLAADRSTNLPLPPIVLNAASGLIGWPVATNQGIEFDCLINPALKVGGLVQINNKSIQQTNAPGGSTQIDQFPTFNSPNQFFALAAADDGLYRVLAKEYIGDSRGNYWYCHCICLLTDATNIPSPGP